MVGAVLLYGCETKGAVEKNISIVNSNITNYPITVDIEYIINNQVGKYPGQMKLSGVVNYKITNKSVVSVGLEFPLVASELFYAEAPNFSIGDDVPGICFMNDKFEKVLKPGEIITLERPLTVLTTRKSFGQIIMVFSSTKKKKGGGLLDVNDIWWLNDTIITSEVVVRNLKEDINKP